MDRAHNTVVLRERLAQAILRRRAIVVLLWVVIVAIFAPLGNRIEAELARTAVGASADSATVSELLKKDFRSPFAQSALLVVRGIPDPRTTGGESMLRRIDSAVAAVPGVIATVSYLDSFDPYLIGEDQNSAVLVAGLDTEEDADAIVLQLQETSATFLSEAQNEAPGLSMRWTSEALLNREFREISGQEASRGELIALPLTLAVLVIVFGGIATALFPLTAGAVAIPVALGAAAVFATALPLTSIIVNVVTMIGLALSIDYSLLIVDRFRQARMSGCDKREAALDSVRVAGLTVLVSGAAVAVGFAALLAVPVDELRSVAVGGLLATLTAVFLSTTLLPVALSYFGPSAKLVQSRTPSGRWTRGPWLHWARLVVAHPLLVALLAGAPVTALAWQAVRIELELPRGEWLPKQAQSSQAIDDLRLIGRGTMADSVLLVLKTPEGSRIDQSEGWNALQFLTDMLARDPQIERVTSLASLPVASLGGSRTASLLPSSVSRGLVTDDRRLALVEVVPTHDLQAFQTSRLVRDLRRSVSTTPELSGYQILIGGRSASEVDYEDAVTGSFASVIALVLAGTLATLAITFRSILIPLKAVALNLLSVSAGFGAVVLVFQDGYGVELLGLTDVPGSVFPAIPVLVFCAVFGVSMDYEVFMVSRVAEMRLANHSDNEAVIQAVARTGNLITGAAAVMIAVFAAFMIGDLLLMKMLGFALAITVLIDATVVRMAICPALLALGGRWNWWPGNAVQRAT